MRAYEDSGSISTVFVLSTPVISNALQGIVSYIIMNDQSFYSLYVTPELYPAIS